MSDDTKLPFLRGRALKSEKFTAVRPPIETRVVLPPRNAAEHAKLIRDRIRQLGEAVQAQASTKISPGERKIISVRLATSDGVNPDLLESTRKGAQISLLDFDKESGLALLDARPELKPFVTKLSQYEKSIATQAHSLKNRKLIDYVDDIRLAGFADVLGDSLREQWASVNKESAIWIELHCRGGYLNSAEAAGSLSSLSSACVELGIDFKGEKLRLQIAEEDIYFCQMSVNDAAKLFDQVDCIFEIELPPSITLEWLQGEHRSDLLLPTVKIHDPAENAPEVVLLDSGIVGEHPLLKPAISGIHSVLLNESGADTHGHGTEMAGVVLYGDELSSVLQRNEYTPVCRIRSVQIIKAPHEGTASEEMSGAWPAITEKAINAGDSGAVDIQQVFGLAVTAKSKFGDRASSWTCALDKAAFNEGKGRLIFVSTGNQNDFGSAFVSNFPESLLLEKLDEPAHAFNAITVGGWTNLIDLPPKEYEGFTVLSEKGAPSPYSKVGYANSKLSGVKPDVVFEAGNRGVDSNGDSSLGGGISTLSILTTSKTSTNPFVVRSFWGTSCAAALAARFSAQVWAQDTTLRPETVRALIVHSASWTDEMRKAFEGRKDDLLSVCGYGVPDLKLASSCIKNRATMIFEDEMEGAKPLAEGKFERAIRFYEVPVPDELANADEQVSIRVTLSYFAEPNGYRRHISRGLDFAWRMQGPNESADEFRARVNGETRKELKNMGHERTESEDFKWVIGPQKRGRGTIQSDRWTGAASFVAGKKLLAVYPINGWWDRRKDFKVKKQRFSLVVTVETQGFDIYNPIKVAIDNISQNVDVEV